jgi:hypothetical protein
VIHRSARAQALALKGRTYGVDVVVEVGYLRYREHRSIPEIRDRLVERQIEISEREVYELLHVFEELIATRPPALAADFYDAVDEHDGVVLSIDGVQPETGNSVLYVVMDVLTDTVLYADFLENSATEYIEGILREVAKLDLPVIGIVSDHQASIRLAVARTFPGVPHQFCHFHFLRNACGRVVDQDRHLKMEVRKRIRGIKDIERSLAARADARARVGEEYCLALRSLLIHPSTQPLDAGGLEVFDRLKELDASLRRSLDRSTDKELERIERITGRWREFEAEAERLRSLFESVNELRRILGESKSVEWTRGAIDGLMERVRRRATSRKGKDREALLTINKEIESHGAGLFPCYADPRIPRTNNQMEVTIRRVKMDYRRASGRRSWSDFVAQYGRSVFMIPRGATREELEDWVEGTSQEAFEARWAEFEQRRARFKGLRKAARDFPEVLREVEEMWAAA